MNNDVDVVIAAWTPRAFSDVVAVFTRETIVGVHPNSPARARALLYALARLSTFAETMGIALDARTVLRPSVIERFLAASQTSLPHATWRTVASNLRFLYRYGVAGPKPLAIARERAKAPYSNAEIDHYLALAAAQPSRSRAMRATALIALGAGAGLSGVDLRHVKGCDVQSRADGLVVSVGGVHPRVVPVLVRFHGPLLAAAEHARDDYIVGGVEAARKNITSTLIASLAGGADLTPLCVRRLRSTWLTSAAQVIGLRAFMDAAGVDCSQRLGDIVSYLAPSTLERSVELLAR